MKHLCYWFTIAVVVMAMILSAVFWFIGGTLMQIWRNRQTCSDENLIISSNMDDGYHIVDINFERFSWKQNEQFIVNIGNKWRGNGDQGSASPNRENSLACKYQKKCNEWTTPLVKRFSISPKSTNCNTSFTLTLNWEKVKQSTEIQEDLGCSMQKVVDEEWMLCEIPIKMGKLPNSLSIDDMDSQNIDYSDMINTYTLSLSSPLKINRDATTILPQTGSPQAYYKRLTTKIIPKTHKKNSKLEEEAKNCMELYLANKIIMYGSLLLGGIMIYELLRCCYPSKQQPRKEVAILPISNGRKTPNTPTKNHTLKSSLSSSSMTRVYSSSYLNADDESHAEHQGVTHQRSFSRDSDFRIGMSQFSAPSTTNPSNIV